MFLINQTVQIVIGRYNNQKRNIQTEISKESPISSILFFIYISKIFDDIKEVDPAITFLFFIDDLGFIIAGSQSKILP